MKKLRKAAHYVGYAVLVIVGLIVVAVVAYLYLGCVLNGGCFGPVPNT